MGTELTRSGNKYIAVENFLRKDIELGVYSAHDKLPSIRALSTSLNVGKNTVIRAYQELEAQGLLYSVARSGYRVQEHREIQRERQVPNHVDLLSICKEILTYSPSNEKLISGSAHPYIDTPAIKSLYAEIGRQSRKQSHIPSHYQLPPGNPNLLKHLGKISQDLGVFASVEDILVTNGAQQAISLALRALTQPGDIIAVESPCYFGTLLLIESLGLKVVEIPSCEKTGMLPSGLSEAISKWQISAILVTPNYTNPTGSKMPLEQRKELLRVSGCIPIIEDDVFGALSFGDSVAPLKTLDTQDRVIYVNSLSKMLDSRLRIGWIIAGKYRAQLERYLISDNMGSSNLMQSAVSAFLSTGKYRQHVHRMQRMYQSNTKKLMSEILSVFSQHPKIRYKMYQPQGGFLLWINLPNSIDSYQLYQEAKQAGVSILPGTIFSGSSQFDHCIRLSTANVMNTPDWKEGVSLLAQCILSQIE